MSPPCLTFSSPSLIPSHSAEAWADKKVSLLSEGSRTLYPGLSTKSPVSCLMPRYVLTDPGPFHTPSATWSYKRCVMCVSLFTIKEESTVKCSRMKTKMQSQKLVQITYDCKGCGSGSGRICVICPTQGSRFFSVKNVLILKLRQTAFKNIVGIPSTILKNEKELFGFLIFGSYFL